MTKSHVAVAFVAALPPPVQGMPVVSAAVLQVLRRNNVPVTLLDTTPGGSRRQGRFAYYRNRLTRCVRAAVAIATKSTPFSSVYVAASDGIGLLLDLLVLASARTRGSNIFIHHHSFLYLQQWRILPHVVWAISGNNATHIFLCADMAALFKKIYSNSNPRIHIQSNSFILDVNQAASAKEDLYFTIGHLSNLSVDKGTIEFIELCRILHKTGENFKFTLAGPIYDHKVEGSIRDACVELGGAFSYLGPVHGLDKDRFFGSIDLFVFPTKYRAEAQSLVLLEALSFGVPLITTDHGCANCDYDGREDIVKIVNASDVFPGASLSWILEMARSPNRKKIRNSCTDFAADHTRESRAQLSSLVRLLLRPLTETTS